MRTALRKAALAAVILAGLSWLFLKTVRETNAEPYVVDPKELSGWTLALEKPELGGPALLALQPPVQLVADVFRQIFLRTGQSLAGPTRASMPVVLHAEYAAALQAALSPNELLEAARKAGLENERLEPVCLGIKVDSTTTRANQRFFLLFESRGFSAFREELAALLEAAPLSASAKAPAIETPDTTNRGGGGRFDPAALRPILPVASFEPDFHRWPWPLEIDTDADCRAGVTS